MGDNEARREGADVGAAVARADRSKWSQPSASRCRSCHAHVLWVRCTSTGNLMPLDAAPNPEGNVELVDAGAVVHAHPPMFAGELYMPHFATCPHAEQWRAS